MITWAFAKLNVLDEGLMTSIAARLQEGAFLTEFSPRALANTAWAFAALGSAHPALMDRIAAAAARDGVVDALRAQDVAGLVWAFAALRARAGPLMERIVQRCMPPPLWRVHSGFGGWTGGRDALEGKGPRRRSQKRLDRRLEEVAKAVGGGYCRLQMPLKLALGVKETVAGRWLGALKGEGGVTQCFAKNICFAFRFRTVCIYLGRAVHGLTGDITDQ